MSWLLRSAVLTALLTLASTSLVGKPAHPAGPHELKITVRVHTYAKLTPAALAAAGGEATRIFRRAGVELTWLDCTSSLGKPATDPACRRPLAPTDLVLRILAGAPDKTYDLTSDTFGFALVPDDGGDGVYADVFYDAVKQVCRSKQVSAQQMLGCLAAHELGHLLLDELPGKSNYFIGNDPAKWRTNVPHYTKVRYRDVYPDAKRRAGGLIKPIPGGLAPFAPLGIFIHHNPLIPGTPLGNISDTSQITEERRSS